MKKILINLTLVLLLMLSACNMQKAGDYKRISLSAEMAGDKTEVMETTLVKKTKVESVVTETYSDKMPVYKITPREISTEEFKAFADSLGFTAEMTTDSDNSLEFKQGEPGVNWKKLNKVSNNYISYRIAYGDEAPLPYTDEQLKKMAQDVFDSLPLIEGEYEYLGISSTQTLKTDDDEFVVQKRVSFRRLLDGTRVIGNDICDLYFNSTGLSGIQLSLYNYEKTGELDMMTLDEAISKVKSPDAFVLDSDTNKNFTGAADKLTIKRTKLLFVNQYSDGCEILQPVYNLMGTAENAGGSVDFSSRIIAIPEKYTYTSDDKVVSK